MSDETEAGSTEGETNEDRPYETERSTAPQSAYTGRDVGIGALVAIVGLAVTFGVPLAVSF
jgi:hypothetical protein